MVTAFDIIIDYHTYLLEPSVLGKEWKCTILRSAIDEPT